MRVDLSVIIPAFNEEQRVEPTLRALSAYLGSVQEVSGLGYEIIVVDDGSSDGTVALVEGLAAEIPGLRCLATAPNRGKGHAVRVGMLAAAGMVRLMCDADGSTPAAEIPKLIARITAGTCDIAIGSRYVEGAQAGRKQPFYRRWWSRLANQVVQRAVVGGILDTQCGFKAFSAKAADMVFGRARIDGWAFDLEVLALAERQGLRVEEVAVFWSDDPRSRIHPIKDAWRVVREMLVIRRNLRRGVYEPLGKMALPAARPAGASGQLPAAQPAGASGLLPAAR